jgi:hypothetical protein
MAIEFGRITLFGKIRMNDDALSRITRAVLLEGLDDWMDFSSVDYTVRKILCEESKELRLACALTVIQRMLERRWVEVGELGSDGFRPWNLPIPDTLERIERAAIAVKQSEDFGFSDVCWISNTAKGDDLIKKQPNQALQPNAGEAASADEALPPRG